MKRHLVLAGGGHAHMTVITKIQDLVGLGHQVTLIGPSPYHYYSGMGPGMLGGFYAPEEIRFPVKDMTENRGGRFIQDRVLRIDPENHRLHLTSGSTVDYDVVSFNIGSGVPAGDITESDGTVLTVKPIENLLKGREALLDLLKRKGARLVVVGGGPAGLEIAGNLWKRVHEHGGGAQITLLPGRRLLHRFPEKARQLAMSSLTSRGIGVIEGVRVKRLGRGEGLLEDGGSFSYDLCFVAVGVTPPGVFERSRMPVGAGGGLLVNAFLQSPLYPEVLGGGDCIHFLPHPLDKVGVFAVRENPVLYHNLVAALEGKRAIPFQPAKKYLLIFNLGDGKGIFCRGSWVWDGRLAFILKDRIDRRFIKKFCVPVPP
jgi:NADH dehydrogenase FAD-containing subunit